MSEAPGIWSGRARSRNCALRCDRTARCAGRAPHVTRRPRPPFSVSPTGWTYYPVAFSGKLPCVRYEEYPFPCESIRPTQLCERPPETGNRTGRNGAMTGLQLSRAKSLPLGRLKAGIWRRRWRPGNCGGASGARICCPSARYGSHARRSFIFPSKNNAASYRGVY